MKPRQNGLPSAEPRVLTGGESHFHQKQQPLRSVIAPAAAAIAPKWQTRAAALQVRLRSGMHAKPHNTQVVIETVVAAL